MLAPNKHLDINVPAHDFDNCRFQIELGYLLNIFQRSQKDFRKKLLKDLFKKIRVDLLKIFRRKSFDRNLHKIFSSKYLKWFSVEIQRNFRRIFVRSHYHEDLILFDLPFEFQLCFVRVSQNVSFCWETNFYDKYCF